MLNKKKETDEWKEKRALRYRKNITRGPKIRYN